MQQLDQQLQNAAEGGDLARVKDLLAKGADPSARDGTDWTGKGLNDDVTSKIALHWAALYNHVDVIKVLLNDPRVDPSARNFDGDTSKSLNDMM